MYKKVLISVIGFLVSTQAMAQSYQVEGSLGYEKPRFDETMIERQMPGSEWSSSTDKAVFGAIYYFSPVNTDNHPLQEAAFLARNSSLGFSYLHQKRSSSYAYSDEDYSVYSKSTGVYKALFLSAETYLFDDLIYLGGAIARHTSDTKAIYNSFSYLYPAGVTGTQNTRETTSEEGWVFNLGVAPVKNFLIWSEFAKDIDVTDSWNLNAKYVLEFGDKALNLQGGFGHNAFAALTINSIYPANLKLSFGGRDDEESKFDSIYLLSDYYFDRSLSLGLGTSYSDSKEGDEPFYGDSYVIRAKKFFTDAFSLQVQYGTSDDYDSYSIIASMRF